MDSGFGGLDPSPRSHEELEAEKRKRTMFAVIALAVFLFFSIPLQLLCISLCWKRRRRRRAIGAGDDDPGGEGQRPPEMTERTTVYTPSISTATSSDASSEADAHSLGGPEAERPGGSVLPRSAVHRIPAPTKSKKPKAAGKNVKPIGPAEALGIDRDTYFREGMPPGSSSSENIIAAPAKIHVPFEVSRRDYTASSSDGKDLPSPRVESPVQHEVTSINPWECEHRPNGFIFPHLRESQMEMDSEAKTYDPMAVQSPTHTSTNTPQSPIHGSDDMPPSPTYATDAMLQSPSYGPDESSTSIFYGSKDISQSPTYSSNASSQFPNTPQSPTYSADSRDQSPLYGSYGIVHSPSSPGSSISTNGKEASLSVRDDSPCSPSSSVPASYMSPDDALGTIHESGETLMAFQSSSHEQKQHTSDDTDLELIRATSATSATSPSGDSDAQNRVNQCNHCSLSFDTLGRLNTHINRKHRRRYNCEFCNKAFALKTDLERHLRTVHRKRQHSSQVYRCTIPGCTIPTKDFVRKDNFERHVVRCRLRALEQEQGEG